MAALLEAGTGKALIDKIRVEFAKFIKIEEELTAQRYSIASRTTLTTRKITLWLVVLSLIFGSAIAVFTIRGIINSVGKLIKGTEIIGTGDLKHRIKIKSEDEIGELAASFNQMVDKREQTEKALLESKKRIEEIIDKTTAGYFFIDKEGIIQNVNDSWVEIYKYDSKEDIISNRPLVFPYNVLLTKND